MMPLIELQSLITTPGSKGIQAQDVLDALVHHQASVEASNVCNRGVTAQVEFLAKLGVQDTTVLNHIKEAIDG